MPNIDRANGDDGDARTITRAEEKLIDNGLDLSTSLLNLSLHRLRLVWHDKQVIECDLRAAYQERARPGDHHYNVTHHGSLWMGGWEARVGQESSH